MVERQKLDSISSIPPQSLHPQMIMYRGWHTEDFREQPVWVRAEAAKMGLSQHTRSAEWPWAVKKQERVLAKYLQ